MIRLIFNSYYLWLSHVYAQEAIKQDKAENMEARLSCLMISRKYAQKVKA